MAPLIDIKLVWQLKISPTLQDLIILTPLVWKLKFQQLELFLPFHSSINGHFDNWMFRMLSLMAI